jgi:hypothetical protein
MQMSLTTSTPTQRQPKIFGRRRGDAAVNATAAVGDAGRSSVTLTI